VDAASLAVPRRGRAHGSETSYNAEAQRRNDYLFQIAGPTSLKMLEKVTGESLRDIGFLRGFRVFVLSCPVRWRDTEGAGG
jgi:hypothetical protein